MSSASLLSRKRLLAAALALGVVFTPALAEARFGGGFSFGSRGGRTFSPPPITNTAPRAGAPITRSMTPQSAPSPSFSQPSPGGRGLFGSGLGRGLMGGLLGAGLFGLLFGHGLFGGLGGITSFLGLLLQLALVVLVVKLAINWFARRQQPAMAGASPRQMSGVGGFFGGPSPGSAGPTSGTGYRAAPVALADADFSVFERRLGDIQTAYGEEDSNKVRHFVTPEMASYFSEEIADNARKGQVNRVSGVKLLQGDLSEAWREGADEFASLAMRYSLVDVTLDRASGRVVSGDANAPTTATEIWTFHRPAGSGPDAWALSAIQQA